MEFTANRFEAERAELEALLSSGTLGRTNNLVRLLTFVCDKYFDGAVDEIKEYCIAVQVLGRPEDFDPQVDTIVRVTAHALRKRLEDYYRTSGAEHEIRICLPPGHYVPKFVHKIDLTPEELAPTQNERVTKAPRNGPAKIFNAASETPQENSVAPSAPVDPVFHAEPDRSSAREGKTSSHVLALAGIGLLAAGVLMFLAWQRWGRIAPSSSLEKTPAAGAPISGTDRNLRALAGEDRASFVDHAGAKWLSDHYCSGGNSFAVGGHSIQGTEEPQLFTSGRRGIFRCSYPVPPGTYEVHLLFAETAGFQENSRFVGLSINGQAPMTLDLVDDAGGNDIATMKIYPDIEPENDGAIHLDFNNPDAFVNAIEILPTAAHQILPTRIVSGHSAYTDTHGNLWMPDRYFSGGRLSRFVGDLTKVSEGPLYEWHRFGHFRYTLPVAPGSKYTLKLYFLEHWFGIQNGGPGGVGSRVFDVYCNGTTLLKDFDIFREAGSEPLVKSFQHIEPTSQGKIELSFTPSVNYPSVSAIEIIPE